MGMIIEITEHKLDKLGEYIEGVLHYGGRLMSCVEEMREGHHMGYRSHDGYDRYGMGHREPRIEDMWDKEGYIGMRDRMGYRDAEDGEMGERRRRLANGRFY